MKLPAGCYKKNKGKNEKETRERYKILSEEEKSNKQPEYCCEQYQNPYEDEKQKRVKYKVNFDIQLKIQGSNFLVIRADENAMILRQPKFQFLAIRVDKNAAMRVDENAVILGTHLKKLE